MEGFLVAWLLYRSWDFRKSLTTLQWLGLVQSDIACTLSHFTLRMQIVIQCALPRVFRCLSRKRVQHTLSICRADSSIHCSPADVTRPSDLLTGCRRCQTTPLKSTLFQGSLYLPSVLGPQPTGRRWYGGEKLCSGSRVM